MTHLELVPVPPVAQLAGVSQHYGKTVALNNITLDIPARCMVGLIGPDGVGKSSLLSLISGARVIEQGSVMVLGGDMRDPKHRRDVCPRIAWMPQGLGKNLYHTLSVYENVDFFARLFGHDKAEREVRINELLTSTGLAPFRDRPAGKLSGGMKQKLGLCCALIHDPELLILDEPTTGVDPLSRAQFWDLIDSIRQRQSNMSVLVATAYMEEAERFDWLVAMNAGEVLATGSAEELRQQTQSATLEEAFINLLPQAQRQAHQAVVIPPYQPENAEIAIEARDLTMRFGSFVAVDHVNFRIPRGEIFGFLGSNGCGKSTTMKMLTGLLPASEGEAWLFGQPVDPKDIDTRRRVGYMSQAWTLNLSGSRYFIEQPPLTSYDELDRRMRAGDITVAIEIPPNFGRDIARGTPVELGVWIDGAMPSRAETVKGYVQAMHQSWLQDVASRQSTPSSQSVLMNIETRYRYNPDVKSLPAIVPAVIPLLLMMIPSMLSALSVVREKELGSIINLYVTPTTRSEFLLGKQLPYIALGMLNFFLLCGLSVFVFGVPHKGSFLTLTLAALLYIIIATGMGLLISTFMKSQIAAIFGTAIITLIPATQFSGMIDPVASLEGPGRWIGEVYPTSHFLTIARGTFSKALDLTDLWQLFIPLLIAIPLVMGLSILLLKKQEG